MDTYTVPSELLELIPPNARYEKLAETGFAMETHSINNSIGINLLVTIIEGELTALSFQHKIMVSGFSVTERAIKYPTKDQVDTAIVRFVTLANILNETI